MDRMESVPGGTRGRLLAMLRRERRSIGELAGALGITDNAVRTHVTALQRDGLVRIAGVDRTTGGKPAHLYELTREAEERFPKAYAPVLNGLIELLEETEGRERVIELLREVGARAAAVHRAPGGDDEARVGAAAEVLRRLGGDAEVERTESGWTIRGYGCPLAGVVDEHEEACALAEALVTGVAGLPATECCDRSGRPRCVFRVEADATAGGEVPRGRP